LQQINKSTNQLSTMNDPKYTPQILAKDAFGRADTKLMTYFYEKLTK